MSDIKSVESDTKRGVASMSIAEETALEESVRYLNVLAKFYHRGRGDTWGAARDRAAKAAGVQRSYAKRIWDRWQTMTDVSGEAYRRFRAAYEATIERNHAAADAYEAEIQILRAERHATTSGKPAPAGVEKGAAQDRAA